MQLVHHSAHPSAYPCLQAWLQDHLFPRFEAFCRNTLSSPDNGSPSDDSSPDDSSHNALIVDHGLAHRPFFPPPSTPAQGAHSFVIAPTQGLLAPHLASGRQGLVMAKGSPGLSACLGRGVVSFLTVPPLPADQILKRWSGCLTPSGRLCFLMLGDMALWEWGARPASGSPANHPSMTCNSMGHNSLGHNTAVGQTCLSRRALHLLNGLQVDHDHEVWVHLDAPSPQDRHTLEMFFLRGVGATATGTPEATGSLLPSNTVGGGLNSGGRLTLHFIYGSVSRMQEDQFDHTDPMVDPHPFPIIPKALA